MQEDFIHSLTEIIEKHIDDEHFGVSELADATHMSRSNLLRKIKKQTGLSASQFIRQVRLEIAMELLKKQQYTISEISYKVGFGSTSYFTKCFREQYGYPPGEVGKQKDKTSDLQVDSVESAETVESTETVVPQSPPSKKKITPWIIGLVLLVLGLLMWFSIYPLLLTQDNSRDKSIAILPFKNESGDSTNVYFINGLMESTLTNLQKIEDLRVISRTSVEKYRGTHQSIPEIAQELNVRYFVEGSGQKVGDQVLLHIQLIDGKTDEHIWAEQYNRKIEDVFTLQNEVATKIASAIQAIITPEELEQLDKIPTENIQAYDYYLQALNFFHIRSKEGLEKAIPLFTKAIENDEEFALAYAHLAISYYFLEIFQTEKHYLEEINVNADKALLYDSRSAESLLAKAFYYMHTEEYRLAIPHLEKALEYNPNASSVIQTLADIYARYVPNTDKYLEYALKGIQIQGIASDSVQQSYLYIHLSNALIQNGFVDPALTYVDLSMEYYPGNEYSRYLKALILYAKDFDLQRTKIELLRELNKDRSRLDIIQEVAKVYYFNAQYDSAYYFYDRFLQAKATYGLNIYPNEDAKIAYVYEQMGFSQQSDSLLQSYADFCKTDQSMYKSIHNAILLSYQGNVEEAMTSLKHFALQEGVQYWVILFLEDDPLMNPLKSHPDYPETIQKLKRRFWNHKQTLEQTLKEKKLL